MKNYIGILFLMFASLSVFSQNDTAYIHMYGGEGNESFFQIKEAPNNTFILIGYSGTYGQGNSDIYLLKIDSAGNRLWSKTIGSSGIDWGYSITPTSDNGFAIAGYTSSYGANTYDALVIKTDSDGEVLWRKTFGGSDWDFAYAIKEAPGGKLLIAGKTYSFGSGGSDVYIIKTDSEGNVIFEKSFGGTGEDWANDIIIDSDGNYVITGETNSIGTGKKDVLLQKISSTGNLVWEKAFGDSLNEGANSLIQTQDFGYVMAGYCESYKVGGDKEIYNLKTDSTGVFTWHHYFGNATKDDEAKSVFELPDGSLLYTGYTANGAGGTDIFAYIATSGGWWTPASASYGKLNDEMGYSGIYASNKSFYIAGSTTSPQWSTGFLDGLVLVTDTISGAPILFAEKYDDFTLGTDELIAADHFNIYPNPFSQNTGIFFPAEIKLAEISLHVYDITGRIVSVKEVINNNRIDIYFPDQASGVYYVSVYYKENKLLGTAKLIRQ